MDLRSGISYASEPVDHSKLRQLTRDQLAELEPGARAYVRCWRAYSPTPLLVFEGRAGLWVDRKERGGVLRSLILSVFDHNQPCWAEYMIVHSDGSTPLDVTDDGSLMVEDYCMELYDESGQGPAYDARSDESAPNYLRWDRESLRELSYSGLEYTQLHPRAVYRDHRLTIA